MLTEDLAVLRRYVSPVVQRAIAARTMEAVCVCAPIYIYIFQAFSVFCFVYKAVLCVCVFEAKELILVDVCTRILYWQCNFAYPYPLLATLLFLSFFSLSFLAGERVYRRFRALRGDQWG